MAIAEVLPDEVVRAQLDAWLAAQNEGDFERYSALFAERFVGVKRSGDRVYRFDHDGWLENRARMFQRPMTVELSDITIRATANSALVDFTQRWSSATYSDEGPKQLVFVTSPSGLRIAREEMLASELAEYELNADTYLPVLALDGPYAVLTTQASEDWGTGAPTRFPARDGVQAAWRDTAQVPEPYRRASHPVALFTANGDRCEGTLGEPRLIRRVIPHFGTVQVWNGEDGTPASPPQEIANDIWTLGSEHTLLAAPIEGCDAGVIATSREATPVFYAPSPDTDGAALRRFRQEDQWRERQTEFTEEFDGEGPWDAAEPATEVTRWTANGSTWVTIEARGGAGCAEFYGRASSVLEVEGSNITPRSESLPELDFVSVVDLDGDGAPEVLIEDGLLVRSGASYQRVVDLTPAYLDCGC